MEKVFPVYEEAVRVRDRWQASHCYMQLITGKLWVNTDPRNKEGYVQFLNQKLDLSNLVL